MATDSIVSAEPAPVLSVPGTGNMNCSEDEEAEGGHTGAKSNSEQQSTEAYLRFLVETEAKRDNTDDSEGKDKSFQQLFLTDILELGTATSVEGPELLSSGMVHSGSHDRMSQMSGGSGSDHALKDTSFHGSVHSVGCDASGHDWPRGDKSMERLIADTVSQVVRRRGLGLSNIWIPDSGRLVTARVFQRLAKGSSAGLEFFRERCAEMTFKPGEGMPGLVWERGEVEWVNDVTQLSLEEYPRLEIARACGVRATCAIPFVVCGNTLAVLEFVMSEVKEMDQALVAEVQRALATALAIKVNQGAAMNHVRGKTLSRNNSNDNLLAMTAHTERYMAGPLHLRAISEQWAIPRKQLVLGEKIGEGQEGVVHSASWRGMTVVAKTLKLGQPLSVDDHHEVSVLSHLRHPNLVLFLGAVVDAEPWWVVSEYMEGGSLQDLLDARAAERGGKRWRPPAREVFKWGQGLARALCFLHNCSPPIIHRDLKPGNLLLSADGQLKISDFGLSKIVRSKGGQQGSYKMTGLTGTPRYMAPEVLLCSEYDEKVDIYSFGLVLWLMATGGELPLEQEINMLFAKAGMSADVETMLAQELLQGVRPRLTRITLQPLADLMASAWQSDPRDRPAAADIIRHFTAIQEGVGVRGQNKKVSTRGQGPAKPNGKQCVVS